MTRKKVAIIGAGQIAESVHVPNYRLSDQIELVAVVSPDIQKARAFAERHGIPGFYNDSREMLAEVRPDMVSVCSPNCFHYQHVMQALDQGCNVLCEKPPGLNALQAREMHDRAESKRCVLAYNFHYRFTDDVALLAEKIRSGVLGDVYLVKVQALRRSGIPGWGKFTSRAVQGGGPLADIGVHMLDAALYILDFPKIRRVTAKMYQKIATRKSSGTMGRWDPELYDVEDSLFGFIELADGGLILLETSFALNMKDSSVFDVKFFGEEAGASLYPAQIYKDDQGALVEIISRESADKGGHTKSIAAFIRRCLGGEVALVDGRQGAIVQSLVDALYLAAESGDPVTF